MNFASKMMGFETKHLGDIIEILKKSEVKSNDKKLGEDMA